MSLHLSDSTTKNPSVCTSSQLRKHQCIQGFLKSHKVGEGRLGNTDESILASIVLSGTSQWTRGKGSFSPSNKGRYICASKRLCNFS